MNIIIVGMPRSYTSLVAKWYLDHGYSLSSKKESTADYENWEPDYMNDLDVKRLAEEINTNDRCVYKLPWLPLHFDELIPRITVPIQVVYVLRNPLDIISSNMEKQGGTPNYHLLRMAHIYEAVARYSKAIDTEVVFGENYLPRHRRMIRKHNWSISRKVLKVWQWLSWK